MDSRLADVLSERIGELDLRFHENVDLAALMEQDSVPVTLLHAQGSAAYRLGYSRSLTSSSLKWVGVDGPHRERALILGPRVTERSAAMLRRDGINYLDAAGNAYITFDGVHIDVRGRRTTHAASIDHSSAPRGGVNLFSPKRAQVIFVILTWPQFLNGALRDLSAAAGVSVGLAQQTLELLEEYKFLGGGKRIAPHMYEQLMDQWALAYPTNLGSPASTRSFSGNISEIDHGGDSMFVSGEAAVPSLLRPETATLYTHELPVGAIRANRWRHNDENPNIFIRRTFWRAPDGSPGPGVHRAPWPLIYAHLLASKDSRQAEAAQQLREAARWSISLA